MKRAWLIAGILAMLLNTAYAADCPFPVDWASKPALSFEEDSSLGIVSILLDTDDDSQPDLEVIIQLGPSDTATDATVTHGAPLFYIIDKDKDGLPDEVWIDRAGTGLCADVVLYEDLRVSRYWSKRGGL